MAVLEVSDLTFGYTNQHLFQGVTFALNAGERGGLVAPNGAGKSTLLRLLAGEVAPDRGSVVLKKGATLGYYRQSHELPRTGSVLDALLSGFTELLELRRELRAAEAGAASGSSKDLALLAEVSDRYAHSGADQLEHRVETIATRLGFSQSDLNRPIATLSGGERGRLGLGVVLATEPDLLLLDEPTNHLDLPTINWLEAHLLGSRSAVLVVSHDRAFLDAVCPITFELGRTTFRSYPLAYSAYHAAREVDLERERKLAEEQAAFVAKTEDFIRKNIAGQKTKQAQSRRKQLEKLERVARPEDVWAGAERVRFRFAFAPRSGDIVLEARGLTAARGERTLFQGVDLLVRRGDRIGIIGPNGCGKSTLLGLLAGRGQPADRGDVRRGTNLCDGYFDQQLGNLDPQKTAVDEIRSVKGELSIDATRQYLARFRFYGDDPLRQVASFSGGERTRLALAKLLLEPRNLLFLDEPTNHLDIPAAEILEEALASFEGSVLLVSHDRRFLENTTTRTLSFDAERVELHEEGFRGYVEALERLRSAERRPEAPRTKPRERDGAERHRAQKAVQRELEKKQRRLSEVERLIGAAESRRADLKGLLLQAAHDDWEELHRWSSEEQKLGRQLESLMAEWVGLCDELARQGGQSQET